MRKCIVLSVMILLLAGCSNDEIQTVSIAEQFGLAYAPLHIAKELELIEKHLPGIEINWEKMINTASIREAMLSGDLDIGFMGIPPFLIGFDKGMDWKIFRGLNQAPMGLTYRIDKFEGIDSIDQMQKIALPQPGSIQHILLTMYLKANNYPADYLDNNLLTLSHPDGQVALLSDSEVVAHFTSPPYYFDELENENIELLFDGNEAFGGDFTFIVGVVRKDFKNVEVIEGINSGIDEAIEIIRNDPKQAVEILSKIYNLDKVKTENYLYGEGMNFDAKVLGINQFAEFMKAQGYLLEDIREEDVIYEEE